MKKLLVIKKIVLWVLVLLMVVEFILAHYYGCEFNLLTKGNRLYVYWLQTMVLYSLAEELFKFLSRKMSPKRPIEIGDVVRLKSGGPKMVVDAEHYTGSLYCRWFDGNKTLEAAFPQKALKLA